MYDHRVRFSWPCAAVNQPHHLHDNVHYQFHMDHFRWMVWIVVHTCWHFIPISGVLWLKNLQHRIYHLWAGVSRMIHSVLLPLGDTLYSSSQIPLHYKTCKSLFPLILLILTPGVIEVILAGACSAFHHRLVSVCFPGIHTHYDTPPDCRRTCDMPGTFQDHHMKKCNAWPSSGSPDTPRALWWVPS